MYSTILQSTIITRPTGFNIALTNVNARLKQRCINVVQTLFNVISMFCDVVSTLFQRHALMLYQRCATLKIQRRILFHLLHVQKMLETNVSGFLSRADKLRVKNHSLNLFAKQD